MVSAPVYHYRVRDRGAPSITQRRHELRALEDRFAAVEDVWSYLCRHESATQRRRYARTVVAGDLLYHLDRLPDAGEDYRAAFLRRANAFLDAAGPRICDALSPDDRAKWQLVREAAAPRAPRAPPLPADPAPARAGVLADPARSRSGIAGACRSPCASG